MSMKLDINSFSQRHQVQVHSQQWAPFTNSERNCYYWDKNIFCRDALGVAFGKRYL